MKPSKLKKILWMSALVGAVSVGGYVYAQGPGFGPPPGAFGGGGDDNFPAGAQPLPAPKVTVEEKDGYRIMTSNGIPNHATGQFPGPGNPNSIRAQNYKYRMPLKPVAGRAINLHNDVFGVAVNGIPFNPATNEFWNNDRAWNYDALSGKINLGTDVSNAHVQPGGEYHYHGIPTGLIEKLTAAKTDKKPGMLLVGYGSDGFPIYTNLAYAKADDPTSGLKKLHSSYRLKEGNRPGGDEGPGGTYDGTFSADWEYVKGAGDLDECNGRVGVTPEYPKGTFYYVLTEEFPFVPRYLRGTPDPSFNPNRPGPGGFGGPGGPGGRGGGGRGGFGPPPPGFGPPPDGFGPPPPGFGPPPDQFQDQ